MKTGIRFRTHKLQDSTKTWKSPVRKVQSMRCWLTRGTNNSAWRRYGAAVTRENPRVFRSEVSPTNFRSHLACRIIINTPISNGCRRSTTTVAHITTSDNNIENNINNYNPTKDWDHPLWCSSKAKGKGILHLHSAKSRIPQLQRRCSCHRQSGRTVYRP